MPRPSPHRPQDLDVEVLLGKQTAEIKFHIEQQMDTIRQLLKECNSVQTKELQFLAPVSPSAQSSATKLVTTISCGEKTQKAPEQRKPASDDDHGEMPEQGSPKSAPQQSDLVQESHTVQFDEMQAAVDQKPSFFKLIGQRNASESWLDLVMGVFVLLNAATLVVQSQALGAEANASLGLSSDEGAREIQDVCDAIERVFVVLYAVELIVRIFTLRRKWLFNEITGRVRYLNIFDALIVCASVVDSYLVPWFTSGRGMPNMITIRLFRLLRLTRTFRIVRVFSLFKQLRVLALTFVASVGALFWSMVVLVIYMFMGALILSHTLHDFIMDEANDLEMRLWVNSMYGNTAKSMYTMFEVTNSGGWPNYARPLIEQVNAWYALFYCFYVTFVIFATIRIITALFIKETLSAASNDTSLALQEKVRTKDAYKQKLQIVFQEADASGDGTITLQEFQNALESDVVLHYLSILEIEVNEIETLFGLLDDGDGEVTIAEFCSGIMRLKGQARTLDVISIMHDAHNIMAQCSEIKDLVVNLQGSMVPAVQ